MIFRIDEYVEEMSLVLASELGIPAEKLDLAKIDPTQCKQNFTNPSLTPGEEWVKLCVRDLDYLREMKRLEKQRYPPPSISPPYDPNAREEKQLDCVPITGLLVGRVQRIRNELLTV